MSGGRTSFAALVGHVMENSPVDGKNSARPAAPTTPHLRAMSVDQLTFNPYNPRDSLGDLDGLASIADTQLAPVVAVTATKFLALYPDADVTARYVVINGNRRLAAARKFGRPSLDVIVRDDLAINRATLLGAAITENVDRAGFDPIEEAKAVDALVRECGNTEAVGRQLNKTHGWVSQRRALLKLAAPLQDAVRTGQLPLRTARDMAKLSHAEQISRWTPASTEPEPVDPPASPTPTPRGGTEQATRARSLSRTLRKFDSDPAALAGMLHDELGDTGTKTLISLLKKRL